MWYFPLLFIDINSETTELDKNTVEMRIHQTCTTYLLHIIHNNNNNNKNAIYYTIRYWSYHKIRMSSNC